MINLTAIFVYIKLSVIVNKPHYELKNVDKFFRKEYVHIMNIKNSKGSDDIVALKILDELSENDSLSQRALSERLGIALGLVNTYIKNLVKKGYIRVAQFPRARYKYLLTPKGISEKSRLVYKHISYYNNLFKTVRQDSLKLFKKLEKLGIKEINFCGVDEVAEISYLSLKETSIRLKAVYEIDGKYNFLEYSVNPLKDIKTEKDSFFYISSLKRKKDMFQKLIKQGVPTQNISFLGELDE